MKRKAWQGGLSLFELIVALVLLGGVLLMTATVRFNFQWLLNMGMNQATLFLNTHLALNRVVSAIQSANYLEIDAANNALIISKKVGEDYIRSSYYRDNGGNLCYQPDLSKAPLPSPEVVLQSVTGFQLTGFPEGGERFQGARVRIEAKDPQGIAHRDAEFQTAAYCRIFHGSYKPVRVVTRDASGTVSTVKGSYDTIQEAIDAATTENGDVVQVSSNGKTPYYENISFSKALTLEGGYDSSTWRRHFNCGEKPCRIADAYETIIDGGRKGTVIDCTVSANQKTTISGFTIRNGYREDDISSGLKAVAGGASSSIVIENNCITDNEVKASTTGGICVHATGASSHVRIVSNVVSNNQAPQGFPGIYADTSASAVSSLIIISNNLVYENGATNDMIGGMAGGINIAGLCHNTRYVISNNHVHSNSHGGSGGMWFAFARTEPSSVVPQMKVDVFNNRIESNYGGCFGGIALEQYPYTGFEAKVTSTLKNNIITNNNGGGYATAGGIEIWNGRATVQNNLISGNHLVRPLEPILENQRAGGLVVHHSGYQYLNGELVTVANNTIENNEERGVLISAAPGFTTKASVSRNIVRGNTGYNDGGGIFVNTHLTDIFNNLIVGNVASKKGGGIWAFPEATHPIAIANNTIVNNRASVGSGVYSAKASELGYTPPPKDGTLDLRNSIVYNNSISLSLLGHTSQYCLLTDPKFVNSGKGDFALAAGSPAIDAGNPDQKYYDIYDRLTYPTPNPTTPALPPAKGTIRNDIGAYGGPHAGVIGFVKPTVDDPSTPLIREDVIGTYW